MHSGCELEDYLFSILLARRHPLSLCGWEKQVVALYPDKQNVSDVQIAAHDWMTDGNKNYFLYSFCEWNGRSQEEIGITESL